MLAHLELHLRSYGSVREADRHDYAQVVLPVRGEVALEIEGRQGRLDPLHGALVAPGAWHSQVGGSANASLILDVGAQAFAAGPWQQLLERPFTAIGPAARKLVEFMGIVAGSQPLAPSVLQGWTPLLLDHLTLGAPQPASRLAALTERIEAEPGLPWTTDSMARTAGLSVSRLHALFRSERGSSPHAWLLGCRLARACEWLAATDQPVAAIALAAGFSEQSALTRAMRSALDTTPGAYRREYRETGSRPQ
ncbi:helix-turn-helix transcriptional regulator [Massilia yuzhufengensis]|uniref:Transcriptional regulator, AraC family n=1 Tax=Massilia yuzhufengensis TaxID=1164594 RepID=A0A1I1QKY6_9BURK|nr:AraC family transcriptional regulator [Massilia yuzhufengensis]SFD22791.1 transcriptional regulator, AraC family [Massilia yuzhufengensis]